MFEFDLNDNSLLGLVKLAYKISYVSALHVGMDAKNEMELKNENISINNAISYLDNESSRIAENVKKRREVKAIKIIYDVIANPNALKKLTAVLAKIEKRQSIHKAIAILAIIALGIGVICLTTFLFIQ